MMLCKRASLPCRGLSRKDAACAVVVHSRELVRMRYQVDRSIEEDAMSKSWPAAATSLASADDVQAWIKEHPYQGPPEGETGPDLNGEWPMAWGLATLQDLKEYYKTHGPQASVQMQPDAASAVVLEQVMTRDLATVTPDLPVERIRALMLDRGVSGVPVVNEESRLLGVVSRHDLDTRGGETAAEVMSSPPVAAKLDARVKDAAVLMLKHKVHRIPVVDGTARLVGMVTRTDLFNAIYHE